MKREGKLELIKPSEEICSAYLEKADNCLKSARILLKNELYENSVSMSYYVMYNSLTALLYKTGIKCENHAGSIILFKKLFGRSDLFKVVSYAKKERVDKQYYVDFVLNKESADELVKKAENFLVKIKLLIRDLKIVDIEELRQKFVKMI